MERANFLRRPRRLRRHPHLRDLVREHHLHLDDLIYPLFVVEGKDQQEAIASMPGVYRYSPERLIEALAEVVKVGLKAVLFFGIPRHKDAYGTQAYHPEGILQQAIRQTKEHYPDLMVIADVCLCEYTDHGHCGVLKGQQVDNDETLPLLAKMAVECAAAGADMVAPSAMMDGSVAAIRRALDEAGYQETLILSYSSKFASAFYGPFREAAQSAPAFGDRRSYQIDPANAREALYESALDLEEGCDMVMVKPGLPYLDILYQLSQRSPVPVVSYQVSGEYAMVKAAAEKAYIDEKRVVEESLLALKRAGADLIITYYALQYAQWQASGN